MVVTNYYHKDQKMSVNIRLKYKTVIVFGNIDCFTKKISHIEKTLNLKL